MQKIEAWLAKAQETEGGYSHPREWYSNRPSQGPCSAGPGLPKSDALLGLVEGVCRKDEVGVVKSRVVGLKFVFVPSDNLGRKFLASGGVAYHHETLVLWIGKNAI